MDISKVSKNKKSQKKEKEASAFKKVLYGIFVKNIGLKGLALATAALCWALVIALG